MIRDVCCLLLGGAVSAAATFPFGDVADPPLTKSDAERLALSYHRVQSSASEYQRRAHVAELTVEMQRQMITQILREKHAREFATEPSPVTTRPAIAGGDLIPAQNLPTGQE